MVILRATTEECPTTCMTMVVLTPEVEVQMLRGIQEESILVTDIQEIAMMDIQEVPEKNLADL